MNHNYWVQRKPPKNIFGGPLPDPAKTLPGTAPALYGWPVKTTDRAAGLVPMISDSCFSGYSDQGLAGDANPAHINTSLANNLRAAQKYSGHCVGSSLKSVNVTFADSHVELHTFKQIGCVYLNSSQPAGFFY
jgi:prepilin-type processing-associated H-X9-DG protein